MSNNNNNRVANNGISFVGLLTIAFVVLKLCHVIDWPWLWVLSPIWISFALFIAFAFIALFIMLWREEKQKKY